MFETYMLFIIYNADNNDQDGHNIHHEIATHNFDTKHHHNNRKHKHMHRDNQHYSGGNDIQNQLDALDKQIDELDNGKNKNSADKLQHKIDKLERKINEMTEEDHSLGKEEKRVKTQKFSNKSQITAYFLSVVFGGLAAGRFYVGYYELGVLKLICAIIALCGLCTCLCSMCNWWTASTVPRQYRPCHYWCCCCWILILIIFIAWWIADGIMFARNEIPDPDNGLPLHPWRCVFGYDCLFEK